MEWYIKNIQLMVFDFDGVMTDNRVLVDQEGREAVFVNRSDGLAISKLKKKGYRMIILSTESNPVVAVRAKKLDIGVIHGTEDKKETLIKYCRNERINLDEILYIGNDINDAEIMKAVGISVVPADAYPEVKEKADIVLKTKGGYGVIRELYSLIENNREDV